MNFLRRSNTQLTKGMWSIWQTDRKILQKRSIFSQVKCIRRYVSTEPVIILEMVWHKSSRFWQRYAQKWFLHFCSQPPWPLFDLWTSSSLSQLPH